MFRKRTLLGALVGLNLYLLAALIFSVDLLPAAYGQRAGASTNYVAVTCRADKDYDVLYLLDLAQRRLHCFVPNRDRKGGVTYGSSRDLTVDFNR